MKCVDNVVRAAEKIGACRDLVGKSEGKNPLGKNK